MTRKRLKNLHKAWLADPAYRRAHARLAPEFELAETLIAARLRADLSQTEIAERMGTTQPAIARLESGRQIPSTKTLRRYAEATGSRLKIQLVPN